MTDSVRRLLLAFAAAAPALRAQPAPGTDTSAANLMVLLRESAGANFPARSMLTPIPTQNTPGAGGRLIDRELAWYAFLADTHLRFVFDGPSTMPNATPDDLARLGLTPAQALPLAIANIRRVYGEATAEPLAGGVMEVDSPWPDLISSYLLDTAFWANQARAHPQGLVAAVPHRSSLLFAPAADEKAVAALRKGIVDLFERGAHRRVSSALFLFRDGAWRTFQEPVAID